jgi:hypothetical protein
MALLFIKTDGWVAFNIKETFLDHLDYSGFSKFIHELIFSEYFDVCQLECYSLVFPWKVFHLNISRWWGMLQRKFHKTF